MIVNQYPKRISDSWTDLDILALSMVKGINSVLIRSAVEFSPSLDECMYSPPSPALQKIFSADLFSSNSVKLLRIEAEKQLLLCNKTNIRAITFWNREYPALLANIAYPPALLFVKGSLQKRDAICLGIVGTRHCTQYGKLATERFASECSNAGIVIVSGLANGIDTFAHQATLKAKGCTYAVIASGIDSISPALSSIQSQKIVDGGGAIISEYRCGVKALPGYFPQRNRIISGIARAVLVVESGIKGGSLITAQFAADQSRELYAIPGNITSERSTGTNSLILRQMAIPALSPEQILNDLGVVSQFKANEVAIDFTNELERSIYNMLSHEPIIADELADKLNVNINDLLVTLLMMEFRGLVRQLAGKQFLRS